MTRTHRLFAVAWISLTGCTETRFCTEPISLDELPQSCEFQGDAKLGETTFLSMSRSRLKLRFDVDVGGSAAELRYRIDRPRYMHPDNSCIQPNTAWLRGSSGVDREEAPIFVGFSDSEPGLWRFGIVPEACE